MNAVPMWREVMLRAVAADVCICDATKKSKGDPVSDPGRGIIQSGPSSLHI